ncbi:cyclophilin-type peptidyl-prolyl cis-trans isomerase [Chloropicon primus]|uniref:Peptidyl-prolyl cis-trans isomerase n=2 Tax=Chloropicon primus TaxID=1764295 RepID=A0A5B8MPK2_9CHLO|nr:cyclophilin-type peptidyl-prolyl cis-trans isomerase [Chloropicon primus]UPR01574.1 cyclophilin-type peptidyl-prolyl cis-trans isomerase [Chloropicon primus]|eukprot:QDZ22357.1 cyclophilin-type peptidyl-prolyl cis-trans isomerase [Chloropicon primus]
MARCFLDIDVGCPEEHERSRKGYELAVEYLEKKGHVLGIAPGTKPDVLDGEMRDLVRESFGCDPSWSGRASVPPLLFDEPGSLRVGRLVIELFDSRVPKTCENFRCLATGERGLGKASRKPLHYKGAPFHRYVRGKLIQGGDVVKRDGSGGDSIYGGRFNDEKPGLKLKHGGRGTVAMANSGKNSNTSQFYVTLAENLRGLDGKHVVFGRVEEGSMGVLDALERKVAEEGHGGDGGEDPGVPVTIADCGVLAE